MKNLVAMAMAALVASAFADAPTISNVKAQQRYPWNGLVDIDYTITGDTTGLNLSFSVRDEQNDKTYTPKTFLSSPSSGAGTNRATWNPKADGYSIVSTNIVVTVLLTRTVVPPEPTGEHEKVQLWEGGPYWATTNIGAENPEDYGYYFWWGDTVGYTNTGSGWISVKDGSSIWFSSSGTAASTYGKDNAALQSEGWIDSTTNLVAAHDAAHVHWGGNWRMPTKQELEDLNRKCDWAWTMQNGVQGYLVKGKGTYTSASIFLPCAGYGVGPSLYEAGSRGFYFLSVPYSDNGSDYFRAWFLLFDSGAHGPIYLAHRYYGQPVRSVQGFTETNVTITFDANGGAASSSSRSYAANGTYGSLPTATREGYFFAGWFTAASGGTRVTADSPVPTSATTLCAHWEKVPDKVQLWEGGPYWATTNIGAEKPEDYGYYFWWGDTVGYTNTGSGWISVKDGTSFSFSSCPTFGKDNAALQSEGWIDSTGNLVPAHDAAHVHWGGNWRMPTKQELEDLNSKCDWVWTMQNGVQGYLVKGKGTYASASIFLPCAGYGLGTSLNGSGSDGGYWSSVPRSDSGFAWSLFFYSGSYYTGFDSRFYGRSVRPVQGFTN